jgi:hypothetical protein
VGLARARSQKLESGGNPQGTKYRREHRSTTVLTQSVRLHPLSADKVKWLSPRHRFVIARHSPGGVAEPGLRLSLQRKRPQSLPAEFGGTLSPRRFKDESRTITAISRDFQGNAAEFLCSSDRVAERVGFELSAPFLLTPLSALFLATCRD